MGRKGLIVSSTPHCYALRRLNPYAGMLQVVDIEDARALSPDGRHWEIQVLAARPEHDWRSPNAGEPLLRFFRFGVWSVETGLRRVPVSPILDLDALLNGSERLCGILPDCLRQLPFPAGDPYELWLCDRERLPVALLATTQSADYTAKVHPQPWRATALSEHGFVSPHMLRRGVAATDGHNPRVHAARLESLVRANASMPTGLTWLKRADDGTGDALEDAETWHARDFPRLGLREDWNHAQDSELARDYLDWCAPYLLTLPDLDDDRRAHLERAARARALVVETQYRLYPKILQSDLIEAARIEARLRASA